MFGGKPKRPSTDLTGILAQRSMSTMSGEMKSLEFSHKTRPLFVEQFGVGIGFTNWPSKSRGSMNF